MRGLARHGHIPHARARAVEHRDDHEQQRQQGPGDDRAAERRTGLRGDRAVGAVVRHHRIDGGRQGAAQAQPRARGHQHDRDASDCASHRDHGAAAPHPDQRTHRGDARGRLDGEQQADAQQRPDAQCAARTDGGERRQGREQGERQRESRHGLRQSAAERQQELAHHHHADRSCDQRRAARGAQPAADGEHGPTGGRRGGNGQDPAHRPGREEWQQALAGHQHEVDARRLVIPDARIEDVAGAHPLRDLHEHGGVQGGAAEQSRSKHERGERHQDHGVGHRR